MDTVDLKKTPGIENTIYDKGCKCKNVKYLHCSSQHCEKIYFGYIVVAGK